MRCSLRRGVGYTYTYDANGNRATMVSKVDDVVYATTTYSYNIANMVVSMTNDPSNESAQTFAYTYYLDENQRTKTEGTKVTTYAYDYAGRLVSEVTTDNGVPSVGYTYTYDDFGNRLTMTTDGVTTSYTYDLNNRLLKTTAGETTVTYTYNANGDMITEYKVEANIPEQNTTYTYSIYTGMLTSVSSTVGNVNASYDYNASGLRMKNGDTYFIYDGQNIVAEYNLANDEYTAVYGFAVNRVSRFTSGVDGEIYLFNAHGDVVGLVAISGENVGKIIKEYDYDAFGNEVFPDPDDENPFRYCGEYYDKGTNRLYLRARDYDSATGRFTSEDPIGDGLNWYTYCHNNPISFIDPSGMVDVMLSYAMNKADGYYILSKDRKYVTISINGQTYVQRIGNSRENSLVWWNGDYLMMDSVDMQHMFGVDAKSIEHTMDDEYYSIDSAAIAWTIINNPNSIRENREYASLICETKNGYTLSEVMIGTSDEISPAQNVYLLSQNPTAVAHIHSHAACPHERDGGGEIFSGYLFTGSIGDTDFANEKVLPIYLATPGGRLKCYIPPDPNDKNSRYYLYTLGEKFYRDPKCNH